MQGVGAESEIGISSTIPLETISFAFAKIALKGHKYIFSPSRLGYLALVRNQSRRRTTQNLNVVGYGTSSSTP